MNRETGSSATVKTGAQGGRRRLRILLAAAVAVGCGGVVLGEGGWHCDVTLDLDGQMATASGTGAGQAEALNAARRSACSQLGLSGDALTRCERGENPGALSWSIRHSCET